MSHRVSLYTSGCTHPILLNGSNEWWGKLPTLWARASHLCPGPPPFGPWSRGPRLSFPALHGCMSDRQELCTSATDRNNNLFLFCLSRTRPRDVVEDDGSEAVACIPFKAPGVQIKNVAGSPRFPIVFELLQKARDPRCVGTDHWTLLFLSRHGTNQMTQV